MADGEAGIHVEFLIVNITDAEVEATRSRFHFEETYDAPQSGRTYHLEHRMVDEKGSSYWLIANARPQDKGHRPMSNLISAALQEVSPKYIVVVGTGGGIRNRSDIDRIAKGLPPRVSLGTVVVSRDVKYVAFGTEEGNSFVPIDQPHEPPSAFLRSLAQGIIDEWSTLVHRDSVPQGTSEIPRPIQADILAGEALEKGHGVELNPTRFDGIIAQHKDAAIVDMESGAVASVLYEQKHSARCEGYLAVRAVSDMVNVPGQNDDSTRSQYRFHAASAAAIFSRLLVERAAPVLARKESPGPIQFEAGGGLIPFLLSEIPSAGIDGSYGPAELHKATVGQVFLLRGCSSSEAGLQVDFQASRLTPKYAIAPAEALELRRHSRNLAKRKRKNTKWEDSLTPGPVYFHPGLLDVSPPTFHAHPTKASITMAFNELIQDPRWVSVRSRLAPHAADVGNTQLPRLLVTQNVLLLDDELDGQRYWVVVAQRAAREDLLQWERGSWEVSFGEGMSYRARRNDNTKFDPASGVESVQDAALRGLREEFGKMAARDLSPDSFHITGIAFERTNWNIGIMTLCVLRMGWKRLLDSWQGAEDAAEHDQLVAVPLLGSVVRPLLTGIGERPVTDLTACTTLTRFSNEQLFRGKECIRRFHSFALINLATAWWYLEQGQGRSL